MNIQALSHRMTVCKAEQLAQLPQGLCFFARTDEEISLVCETEKTPACAAAREDGWRVMRVAGVLDFSLIGILAGICDVLAAEQIGVFVVSTYNTDYVLTKETRFEDALSALERAGYEVTR